MYGSVEARRRRDNFGDILLPENVFCCFYSVFDAFLKDFF